VAVVLLIPIAPWVPSLLPYQPNRASGYLLPLAYVYVGYWAGRLMLQRKMQTVVASLAVIGLVMLPKDATVVQVFRVLSPAAPLAADAPVAHLDPDDVLFRDIARWARTNTPIEAHFVTPLDWIPFRVLSRRGVVVTGEDAPFFSADLLRRWYDTYQEVYAAYQSNDTAQFAALTRAHQADYIVVDRSRNSLGFLTAYTNEKYAVYWGPK